MSVHIGWPQGILLAWFLIAIIEACMEPVRPTVRVRVAAAVIRLVLFLALLWWGGFFNGAPQ